MKQRLVGTVVLGSLALIVIPLLLDGEGVERPPLSATIPPAPVIDTTPLPEPEHPEILADNFPAADVEEAVPAITTPSDAPADVELPDVATASTEPEAEPVAAPELPADAAPVAITSTPALDASGLPEGWIVRLGAFSNRANADALVTRLVAAGHKAYIRPVMSGDVALNGVFVGPVPTRNEANALQTELKSRFQINDAIVQRYDIAQ